MVVSESCEHFNNKMRECVTQLVCIHLLDTMFYICRPEF